MKTLVFCFVLLVSALNAQTVQSLMPQKSTRHGYQYQHLKVNAGNHPQPGEYAYCNIYIYQNDTLVASNMMNGVETAMVPYSNPDITPVDDQPIMAALEMMSVGDSMILYHNEDSLRQFMPPGYPVPKVAYHLFLKSIRTSEEYEQDIADIKLRQEQEQEITMRRVPAITDSLNQILDAYDEGTLDNKLITTPSGLEYLILHAGNGALPVAGESVVAHYFGALMDGKSFDSSYSRGETFSFRVGEGQVIAGWDEAFSLLKRGSVAVLFIPSELAYGKQGAGGVIPPDATLVFYVELL